MSTPKKPTPSKSKISKKPSVEFEISDEDLDKASGGAAIGGGGILGPDTATGRPIRPTGGRSIEGCEPF